MTTEAKPEIPVSLTELDRFVKDLTPIYPLTAALADLFYSGTDDYRWSSSAKLDTLQLPFQRPQLPLTIRGAFAGIEINDAIWVDLRNKGINRVITVLNAYGLVKIAVGDGELNGVGMGGFQVIFDELRQPAGLEAIGWVTNIIKLANREVTVVSRTHDIRMIPLFNEIR